MRWMSEHIHGGQLVASQTTGGGFKDVLVLSKIGKAWGKVSLLDGYCSIVGSEEDMAKWLNDHQFTPISKTVTEYSSVLAPPENRLGLPQVQIISLRNKP